MQPKQIWANLGVKDVSRTREFYTKLGIKSNEDHDNGGDQLTSFLFGNDFAIHFFEANFLKQSFEGELTDLTKSNEIMFSLWADSKEEADQWAEEVRNAGGTIFSEPKAFGNNYYGFGFADPDGHKFNVFHM
ncbi:VOC family protein [Mucilaginibacter sp.]|uniref:VOC family protein n=1 Tax=Mucilaginibacter sp. TaxID=1882438 RepID=UPI0035BC0735